MAALGNDFIKEGVLMKIVKVILIGCMLISTCAACAPAQPEQKEKEKTFFEQRYTTLSYDEYFSQMRSLWGYPFINTDDVAPSMDGYSLRGELGDETLYVIPVDSETEIRDVYGTKVYAAPADNAKEIKVLEHIKEKQNAGCSREKICVTTDDKIYSVDLCTGDKFLLYESPTSVSHLYATDDFIVYSTGNTVYRLFRPTGRVDEIPLQIEEGQTLEGLSLLANMLLRYSTVENPEYTECVAMNPGGRDAEVTCWEKLAEKYGDYVWELKSYLDASGDFHPTMERVLDRLWVSESIAYTYDLQTGQVYKYNPYQLCPCPHSDICQSFIG